VEVGVWCFHKGEHTATHNWLVNPGMPIPEQARNVHGITDEMVASEPHFDAVAAEVIAVLKGHLPVAYNAPFDRKFLHAEMARTSIRGKKPPATDPAVTWVDPLVWVRELQKYEKSKKLGAVCERMGIELNDAHRAWADAEATGKVLMGLAEQMPKNYGELIRIQDQYAAQQEAEMAAWRSRRS
jgi:DNA polymerase-3 subunit epsilon